MNKEQVAIERLKTAAELSELHYKRPLMICYSGGKDSDVLLHLAIKSGIRMEVVHSHTTVDMPETVYHVRDVFYRLENLGIPCMVHMPMYKGKQVTMWTLIPQKRMPPTRMVRYCCEVLKENAGKNRFIATGVRWNESSRRKNSRGIFERNHRSSDKRIILSNDNDDARRLFESCRLKSKRTVNPIIDWTDQELWDYIYVEKIDVCKMYDCGFRRLGCIGCPLAGKHSREIEFREFPTYKHAYIRAFDRMIEHRIADGLETDWQNGNDCFDWWME